jgi:hypothetical protein
MYTLFLLLHRYFCSCSAVPLFIGFVENRSQEGALSDLSAPVGAYLRPPPHLRNVHSIANQNTLIYVIINLRTLHRIRTRKAHGR